jgi:hypothetical protein
MARHIIERFIKMTKDEVLDSFARLPNAESFKDFVFIPGTKDPRLLLVGHADTVFDGPPPGINWLGNIAKVGDKYTLITGPAYVGPRQVDPPKAKPVEIVKEITPAVAAAAAAENPNPTESTVVTVAVAENAGETVEEEVEEKGKGKKGKKKDKKKAIKDEAPDFKWDENSQQAYVVVGKERLSIEEYRKRVEDDHRTANAAARPAAVVHTPQYNQYGGGGNWNGHRGGHSSYKSYQRRGLGADDRVGVAMMWMMRNSGHSILITDGEESGGRGAKAAARTIADRLAQHQFAIEVDRMWDQEMVFYDVSTKEFEAYMQRISGFRIERGSYTDIADVCRAAGICGVNLAAGYWGQHTESEMFNYDAWLRTLKVVRGLCYERGELPRFELRREAPKQQETKASSPTSPPAPSTTANAGTDRGTASTGPTLNGKSPSPSIMGTPPKTVTEPSPYKGGPRFPQDRAVKTEAGVAAIQTRVDPQTHQTKTERVVVSEGDDLFPEGSLPIEQALDDITRATQHGIALGAAAVEADKEIAAAVAAENGNVAPILAMQFMNAGELH